MGGARDTAWRDTLEGANFAQEERIAREAIQNSVDATRPNEKTEVIVRAKTLSAADMAVVRDALALDAPDSPIGRLDMLGLPNPRIKDAVSLGIDGMDDPAAIDALETALANEEPTEFIRYSLTRVLEQLRETEKEMGDKQNDLPN